MPPRARVVPRHEPPHPLPLLGPLLGVLLVPVIMAPASRRYRRAFSFHETKDKFQPLLGDRNKTAAGHNTVKQDATGESQSEDVHLPTSTC